MQRYLSHLAAICIAVSGAARADTVQLNLNDATALAATALQQGQSDFALDIAQQLLVADPANARARMIATQAFMQSGNWRAAYLSARSGFRQARTPSEHLAMANAASVAAYRDERPTLSQLWLRRASIYAESDRAQQQIANDYRRVSRQNPLRVTADMSFAQSDNVNGGADTEYNTIDGLTTIGRLSADAQALSGYRVGFGVTAEYRVTETADYDFRFLSRLSSQNVILSEESRDASPDSKNSDFASNRLSIGAQYRRAIGPTRLSLQWNTGRIWSAGDPYYDFVRGRVGAEWRIGQHWNFGVDTTRENRFSRQDVTWSDEITAHSINAGRSFASGPLAGRARISFNQSQTDSTSSNRRNDIQSLSLSYDFAKQIGPSKLSVQLGRSWADYPDYAIIVPVPGGRQDDTTYAQINVTFADYSYAGFSPTMTISGQWSDSNVSRFDRSTAGVEFGFRSSF